MREEKTYREIQIPASPVKTFILGLVLGLAFAAGVGFGWHPVLLACLVVCILLLVISFCIASRFSDDAASLKDNSTSISK